MLVDIDESKHFLEKERSVGGDCYHTICMFDMKFYFISIGGAMAIAPYGFFEKPKHYDLTHFSHKLFLNIKIVKKERV